VGASGAVVSVTVVVTESEIFPLLSIAATNNSSPPVNFTFSGIAIEYSPCALAFPSAVLPSGKVIVTVEPGSAVPVAVVPSGNITVTVDPGSDVPLTVLSSLVTSSNVGASGAVVSVTVVV